MARPFKVLWDLPKDYFGIIKEFKSKGITCELLLLKYTIQVWRQNNLIGGKNDFGYTVGVKSRMDHDDNLDLCGGGRNRGVLNK